MDKPDSEGEARGWPTDHLAPLAGSSVAGHLAIDAAIKYLAPGASHSTIPALLFDARVSSHTVRAWRNGWRSVPQWAKDTLYQRIAERLAPGAKIQAAVRAAPIGRGASWNKGAAVGLGEWRARRQSSS